ncbi:UBX domain-containing protein 11 isoform X1 [Hydra vulgaris]|uniref:UBX domain-containing protein 11 n=1 Tax=Hydra vulgaris TaxID=6087 RepID=T2MBX3_HYDVU|nr:UBX domain-containing protein 11 [Hydra vulgaris]
MSSPLSTLRKGRRLSLKAGFGSTPFHSDIKVLDKELSNTCKNPKVLDHELMVLMTSRLTILERKLVEAQQLNMEKDRQIKVLEEKCFRYEKSEVATQSQQTDSELKTKCYRLQKQVHDMEAFLEDYGMIWCGDSENGDNNENKDIIQIKRKSYQEKLRNKTNVFKMDFDLVVNNIEKLNWLAGEGEHYIKHTKDGAKLQIKEPVSLTLYNNGIVMFAGPFRPYSESTTQVCMKDIMDGYFPTELKTMYPNGVLFQVIDKRDTLYKNKNLEKIFPGVGLTLSPDKVKSENRKVEYDHNNGNKESVEKFLSKLPICKIEAGRVIDVRLGIKDMLKPASSNNVLVERDLCEEIKFRPSSSGKRSNYSNVTTLRIKSETGDQTYLLRMRYDQTVGDVYRYLDSIRNHQSLYQLKSSFPNKTFTDFDITLKDCGLVPNATLHIQESRTNNGVS